MQREGNSELDEVEFKKPKLPESTEFKMPPAPTTSGNNVTASSTGSDSYLSD